MSSVTRSKKVAGLGFGGYDIVTLTRPWVASSTAFAHQGRIVAFITLAVESQVSALIVVCAEAPVASRQTAAVATDRLRAAFRISLLPVAAAMDSPSGVFVSARRA